MAKKRTREVTSAAEDIPFEEVTTSKERPLIDVSFNNQEAKFESIPSPEDSPLNEPVKQRTGGDDFIQQQKSQFDTPNPNNNTTYQAPPIQPGEASEFTIEDPEALLMKEEESKIDDLDKETIEGSSDMLSDTIINLLDMVAPEAAEAYFKIPEGKIKDLEKGDKLPEGTIDHARKINKDQRKSVRLEKTEKDILRKPLAKVLEGKGAKTKPEWILLFCLLAVCLMVWIRAQAVKRENDERVIEWIETYAKAKAKARREIELAEKAKEDQSKVVV